MRLIQRLSLINESKYNNLLALAHFLSGHLYISIVHFHHPHGHPVPRKHVSEAIRNHMFTERYRTWWRVHGQRIRKYPGTYSTQRREICVGLRIELPSQGNGG